LLICCNLDVIGLMTGISAEREYIRDGKITKMVIIELTDHRYISLFFVFYIGFLLIIYLLCNSVIFRNHLQILFISVAKLNVHYSVIMLMSWTREWEKQVMGYLLLLSSLQRSRYSEVVFFLFFFVLPSYVFCVFFL
jgi:hypothetical protein